MQEIARQESGRTISLEFCRGGKGKIYDGSFSGTLTDGDGVCAEYLTRMGIRVLTENEIDVLL